MSITVYEKRTELGLERRCRDCGEWWPLDFFVRDRSCFRGHRPVCRGCRAEYKRERYRRNRAELERILRYRRISAARRVGRCNSCSRLVVPGRRRCEWHLAVEARRARKRRADAKAA